MPVKKKKRAKQIERLMSPTEQKKFQRQVDKLIDDADEKAAERVKWADRIIEAQDRKTRQAFEDFVEILWRLASANGGPVVKVHIDGWPGYVTVPQPKSLTENTLRYIAVRMIVECAKWDVRMENFKMPKAKKKGRG